MTIILSLFTPIVRLRRLSAVEGTGILNLGQLRLSNDLWRAHLAGDRQVVRESSGHILQTIGEFDDAETVARILGIAACAHATTVDVCVLGDLLPWVDEVKKELGAVRLQLRDFGMGLHVSLVEPLKRLEKHVQVIRQELDEVGKQANLYPGTLVKAICGLGDVHLGNEVAHSLMAKGDDAAGRNCRAAFIRQLDTEETLKLSADLVAESPNSYTCNVRTGTLMDRFSQTGEIDYYMKAADSAMRSLLLTDTFAKRCKYTFASVARVVRVRDQALGDEAMKLSYAAQKLVESKARICVDKCSEIGIDCLCELSISELWTKMINVVFKFGRDDIADQLISKFEEPF